MPLKNHGFVIYYSLAIFTQRAAQGSSPSEHWRWNRWTTTKGMTIAKEVHRIWSLLPNNESIPSRLHRATINLHGTSSDESGDFNEAGESSQPLVLDRPQLPQDPDDEIEAQHMPSSALVAASTRRPKSNICCFKTIGRECRWWRYQ